MTTSKILDWSLKILSALVLPLLAWGVSVQSQLAVKNTEILRLQEDVKTALALKDTITTNAQIMARLEEKLNGTIANLQEIKGLLRHP